MKIDWAPLGKLLELHREPVDLDDLGRYSRIGMYSWGKGVFQRDPVSGHEMGSLRYFKVPAGALVVSNIQAWEGALALSSSEDSRCLGSNRFLSYLAVAPEQVDLRYVLQYLLSEDGFAEVQRASPGTQVRNRTLSMEKFESILVPVPGIDDQRRIAARLNSVRTAATAMTGGALALNAVHAVAGGRPWDMPLSELLELDVDEFDVDDSAAYQRAGVLNAGRGLFSQGELQGRDTKYSRLRRIRAGQVVLSRLKAFEGAVALVPERFDGHVLSQEFPTFSLRSGASPGVLHALLTNPRFWGQLQALSTGVGARRERVSAEAFLAMCVPRLTAVEQQRVTDLHRLVSRHEDLVSHRATLAAALLPAARNEVFSQLR